MMAALYWLFLVCLSGHLVHVQPYTLYRWIVDSSTTFNYDPSSTNNLGVYNWRYTYPESCGGEQQSPIDIQTDRVRYGQDLPCPRMLYTTTLLSGELKNNGHSATFEPLNESAFRLTNIPYRPGVYNMNDFHLHYGGVSGRISEQQGQRFRGSGMMSAGSEHTIDGLRFEGELHFVFYNSKYRNLEAADNKTDGVVIVVLLVQKLPGNITDSGETSSFSNFLEMNIPRIAPYQQNATLDVDLSMFFNRGCQFYTYFGSTTTPVCHESVQWFILRQPIRVTERAWFQLTRLQSRGDFNARFGNYRPTQPMNRRVIEANFAMNMGPVLPSPNSQTVRSRLDSMRMDMASRSAQRRANNLSMQGGNRQGINNSIPFNNKVDQRMSRQNGMSRQSGISRQSGLGIQNSMVGQGTMGKQRLLSPQSNTMKMFNTGLLTQSRHPEPQFMTGNRQREMVANNLNLFPSIRMSNSANIARPDANQIMLKHIQISNQHEFTKINSEFPYKGMTKGERHHNLPNLSRQEIRALKPELIQRFAFPLEKGINWKFGSSGGHVGISPNRHMKDSFVKGFYASDLWKKICEMWQRKMY